MKIDQLQMQYLYGFKRSKREGMKTNSCRAILERGVELFTLLFLFAVGRTQ